MPGWDRLWLAMLAVAALGPALAAEFVLDDHSAIVRSACVTGPLRPDLIVTTNFWCQVEGPRTVDAWRPLVVGLWWLLWHVGAGSPLPFHMVGVALHTGCTVAVVRVARVLELPRASAVVAAAAFAVLPIHVDAVASVVGMADALSTLAVLLAVHAWCRARWSSIVWAALAVTAKESGVVAVVVFALFATFGRQPSGRDRTRQLRMLAAAAVLVGLALVARGVVLGSFTGQHIRATVNPLLLEPWSSRIPAAFDLLWRYVRLTTFGFPLSADYSVAAVSVGARVHRPGVALGIVIVGGLVALLLRRPHPTTRVLVLWFAAAFGVVSNVVALLPAIMAERLFYGPSAALCLALGAAFGVAVSRPGWQRTAFVLWLVAQLGLSMWHARAWTTEDRITQATVAHVPRSARAHVWRARVAARSGDAGTLERHATAAVEILPGWAAPHALLGASFDMSGRPELALASFRRALEIEPGDPEVADLFIQFLLRYGHGTQAVHVYQTHARARGGIPSNDVTRPPGEGGRLRP